MRRCCFCNIIRTHESRVTFHKFPLKDQRLLKQWINNFPTKNWTPTNSAILCSNHFTEDCFERSAFKVRLKPNSIPTRFDNPPHSYCIYCKRKRIYKSGYSFFKFPVDKSDLLKKWLDNIGIKNWTPNNSSLLCSEHFEETCFRKIGKYLKLKEGSVPTIFKVEYFNNLKSEFNQKIHFNDNDEFDPLQQASCNELRKQHSGEENANKLSMSDNIGIISSIIHDHHYDASPATLRRKLIKSQKILKSKDRIIKLQRRQLQHLRIRLMNLKDIIMKLRRQRIVKPMHQKII
ncbi:PREDICTED: THAP domain-containing protein 1-like isoform X3 [Trachymyrmex septentrionalis]|uniref:THAP domain-containing protein 1-like isoform X3 n=1 Tax=Trachymyrmex septentrionalis TaxID=34720 RepID=UPI00084F3010|nr:PREDICTED: THAP domain-containing protein 1-like isoform X3 [Trachymyrmex septentrionalis]